MSAAGLQKGAAADAGGALVTHPITYPVTTTEIDKLRAEYAALAAADPADPQVYEAIRVAVGRLRAMRGAVEGRRQDLKAGALDYGRKVDAAAKVLIGGIASIEDPLKAKKQAVDDEVERLKREAEKAEVLALEAKLKAEREAEEKRLADERARHDADRAAFDKRQQEAEEKRKAEQAAIDAQRAELDRKTRELAEQQAATARAEEERQAKIRAEEEAKAAAERARVDQEQAARAAAAEVARLDAMRPDIEKVRAWAPAFVALAESAPEVTAPEAQQAITWARARLLKIAEAIETFEPTTEG